VIPIIIDISSTVEMFSLSKGQVESFTNLLLSDITSSYMQKWEKIVNKNLKGTKDSYILGMGYERPDNNSVVFKLDGKGESRLGLMIEAGASVFDQKEGFSKSSKKHKKKDGGWYLTIPFRVATPEAIGESSVFIGKMDKTIQKLVKKEGVLTVKNVPKELQIIGSRAEISSPTKTYPEYKHKSFQFEGLRHKEKSKHGQYQMFRRVSDNSDDNAWIHPGFQPRNFMEQAMQEIQIDKIFEQSRQQFLSEML
jgi:hypothetical protein